MSEPQMQTRESIIDYANKNGILGDIFIAKDSASHEILSRYFDFGYIYVFDGNKKLLDCNIESRGGRCFQDIQDDICKQVEIKKRDKLDIDGVMIWNKLLENAECITDGCKGEGIDFNEYDYIIIYPWVMYSKSCIDESSIRFIKCSINSKYRIRVVTVNTDYCSHF
ncbi:MAG: hypothetical protein RMJ33_13455 [Saprospiraceae bacterium]|nr:hypothetical protein [Saprospiraceae bacterium]